MGQTLRRLQELDRLGYCGPTDFTDTEDPTNTPRRRKKNKTNDVITRFPNIENLPPELSLNILSHLNATDLCLAACVWENLANDEILWLGLCRDSWGYTSAYRKKPSGLTYKRIYLLLDEASLTFNFDPFEGARYLFEHGLLNDNPMEIARFLHHTKRIRPARKREYLDQRRDALSKMVQLQNFENQFLPNALRNFFGEVSAPEQRGDYLEDIIEKFSERFCSCNPQLGLSKDAVFVLCFSLIMLSVDLASPHVKNKMSKREFIRNTRRATEGVSDDLAGHLYDNIYLIGHVAVEDR